MLATLLGLSVLLPIGGMRLLTPSPELGTPAVTTRGLDPEERAYVEFVYPRSSALDRESANVAALGEARSRDPLALLNGQRRVETLLADIAAYIDSHGVPPAFEPSAMEFGAGARQAKEAIREARAALARLDWERLDVAVRAFSLAAAAFKSAASALSDEATRAGL